MKFVLSEMMKQNCEIELSLSYAPWSRYVIWHKWLRALVGLGHEGLTWTNAYHHLHIQEHI